MQVTEVRNINELLVRFDLQGRFSGAHAKFARFLSEDGVTPISQPEVQHAEEADWAHPDVQQFLGDALLQIQATAHALTIENQRLREEISALRPIDPHLDQVAAQA